MKNPFIVISISIFSIILLLIMLAFTLCPYKYNQQIYINGDADITAKDLKPFSYSPKEELYMTNCVFIGWSYSQVYLVDSLSDETRIDFVPSHERYCEIPVCQRSSNADPWFRNPDRGNGLGGRAGELP